MLTKTWVMDDAYYSFARRLVAFLSLGEISRHNRAERLRHEEGRRKERELTPRMQPLRLCCGLQRRKGLDYYGVVMMMDCKAVANTIGYSRVNQTTSRITSSAAVAAGMSWLLDSRMV